MVRGAVVLGASAALAAGVMLARCGIREFGGVIDVLWASSERGGLEHTLHSSHVSTCANVHAVCRTFSPGYRLNKLLNGNLRLFGPSDRRALRVLAQSGEKQYLLQNWPVPGHNDAAKRSLVAAASGIGAQPAELERLRLGEWRWGIGDCWLSFVFTGAGNDADADALLRSSPIDLEGKCRPAPAHSPPLSLADVLEGPVAAKDPRTLTQHGDARSDGYYWLRDDDRADRRVLAHLAAENAYAKAVLADTEAVQGQLYREMRGRIQEADESVPVRDGPYMYYSRTLEGAQYSVHCRRRLSPDALARKPSGGWPTGALHWIGGGMHPNEGI